jgi:hypothetical protein
MGRRSPIARSPALQTKRGLGALGNGVGDANLSLLRRSLFMSFAAVEFETAVP